MSRRAAPRTSTSPDGPRCSRSWPRPASHPREQSSSSAKWETDAEARGIPRLERTVEQSASLALEMADGSLEGIVLKDVTPPYRDGRRVGWSEVKDPSWYAREAWRFER